ncbi:serine O-acetyltransferase [Ornithobacterium rhinotracheale]
MAFNNCFEKNIIFAQNKKKYKVKLNQIYKYIKSDFYRCYGGNLEEYRGRNIKLFIKILIYSIIPFHSGFKYLFWLRLCQHKNPFYYLARIVHFLLTHFYSIELDRHVKMGYGFFLPHKSPQVVNWQTEFGDNISLYQFCSIGSNNGEVAKIGNNVYIGPHVSIVNGVKIGNNVTIGAGSVVVHDIPDNATVVGVPAKIISLKPKELVVNKWVNA